VNAGNCVSCHTRPGGGSFAGGVAFQTPLGIIYSTNITPDRTTGIGSWTERDLKRAMREGVGANGSALFPAFPYTSFTRVTDADIAAIYAYLCTLPPIRYIPPGNGFLLQRWALRFWKAAVLEPGPRAPDPTRSSEWNRGAYLVEGLGHCSACHTPRNTFLAEIISRRYGGGRIMSAVDQHRERPWSAVNLTSSRDGLASWSESELTKYLKSGFSRRAGTFGPMNEVIVNSLSKLSDADVHAMAAYLKTLAPIAAPVRVRARPDPRGESIYEQRCKQCHLASGRGGILTAPPLAGSAVVQASDPASLINIILYGAPTPESLSSGPWEAMKPYADVLTNEEIAAVSNYIRASWGNESRPVSVAEIARQH
jgi:mono/diheme cytochrome c family protein